MLSEVNTVKRFLGIKFGYGEIIPDGVYAVPCTTSKGNAFMKMTFKDGQPFGKRNYWLFWDEKLTIDWYDNPKPFFRKETKFTKLFRKIEKL